MRRVFTTAVLFLALAGIAHAQAANEFHWSGAIDRGKTIEIKGINGSVRAELSPGAQVEVTADKHGRRSDPRDVRIEVVQENGNVTICAVYPPPASWLGIGDGRPNECRPGREGRMNVGRNDANVDFSVRLPEGVRFVGRTVNGSVAGDSLKSDVMLRTVNGRIALSTTGEGDAQTVNGSIEASLGELAGSGRLEFKTVNGSINLRLPRDADADLHAETVNGRFESELPLTVRSMSRRNRRVDGTLGRGGRELDVRTVNGGIRLQLVTTN
jgi:DUF4097 and DUF4098 domain-containing protein YvlB